MYKGDLFFNFHDIHFYAHDYKENPNYIKFEKGIEVDLKHITPLNYFKECSKAKKQPIENDYVMVDKELSEKYVQLMMNGVKFPVPFINYINGEQEGRHRAYAVHLLIKNNQINSTKIPVHIIKKSNFTIEEHEKYIINKFGKNVWINYFLPNYS